MKLKPTVLFLFNSSSYAPQPWLDDGGYNVVSVDYDNTDHSGTPRPTGGHTRLNLDLTAPDVVLQINSALTDLGFAQPSFILSFTPCTDMAVSGAAHFARKAAKVPNFQAKAVALARLVEQWPCPSIVENPVSILATRWKKPTGYVHPWMFAHQCPSGAHPEFPDVIPASDMYPKKTGLWCQNGAKMPIQSSFVVPELAQFHGHTNLGGKSARTKYIRSLTPRGLAAAIYQANTTE